MQRWIILGIMAALLAGCGGPQVVPTAAPAPTAAPIGQAIIVGYDETNGNHVTDIELYRDPAGVFPAQQVGWAHEGDRVAVLETANNGDALRVRMPAGLEGWTQRDFVKRR
jgi:hypothetical protein